MLHYYNRFDCFSLFLSSYPCPNDTLSLSPPPLSLLYYIPLLLLSFFFSPNYIHFITHFTHQHTHTQREREREQYHTHTHTLYTYSSLLVIAVNIPGSIRTDHNYLLKHLSLCVRDAPTRQIYIYIYKRCFHSP